MSRPKNKAEDLSARCGQLRDDDNIDPRTFFRDKIGKKDRKALQVSRQVFETLSYVLSSSHDETLQHLLVLAVEPAPDSSRMLVTVQRGDLDAEISNADVLHELQQAVGWLRTEIAASITRKRVPVLIFQLQG